jgi:hypothetical protein
LGGWWEGGGEVGCVEGGGLAGGGGGGWWAEDTSVEVEVDTAISGQYSHLVHSLHEANFYRPANPFGKPTTQQHSAMTTFYALFLPQNDLCLPANCRYRE